MENNCTIGYVQHAPPVRINTGPSYTRDWALVALNKEKLPAHHSFANVVDLQTDQSTIGVKDEVHKALGGARFDFPADGLMHHRCGRCAEHRFRTRWS